MATVAQFNQDPNQQQGQNTGGGGQVLNSTGGGGAPSSGSAPAGQASYSPPRQAQSGAPNISQYLAANQGAGQQLAGGITGNIQNQANQLNQNVNTASNTLQGQYQNLNQNLGDQGQQNIQTAFQNPQQLLDAYNASKTQSSSAPLSSDQQNSLNQYNQFQQLNSGGYNQAIGAYGQAGQQAQNNLQSQYQNLAQQTGAAGTEMGRNQLLQNTVGQPGYNQGQQTLDTLFLQATPGVANQLQQNLTGIGNQAQQNIQGFAGDTQSKLAALQGLSGQDQQQIQSLFGGGMGQIRQNVNQEYQNAVTSEAQAPALASRLASNTLNAADLQTLGLDPNEKVYDTFSSTNPDAANLKNYVTTNALSAGPAGLAQVATPDEFARYNALNQLAGGGPGQAAQANIFGGAQAAGGGYNPINVSGQLANDISSRQNYYENEQLKNVMQQYVQGVGGLGGGSAALAGLINGGQIKNADELKTAMQNVANQYAYGEPTPQASWDLMYNSPNSVDVGNDLSKYLTNLQGERDNTASSTQLPLGSNKVLGIPGMPRRFSF